MTELERLREMVLAVMSEQFVYFDTESTKFVLLAKFEAAVRADERAKMAAGFVSAAYAEVQKATQGQSG